MKFGALTISLLVAAGIVGGVSLAQDSGSNASGSKDGSSQEGGAQGDDAKGQDAKSGDAKGDDAEGQDAKGDDAKGQDAKGDDAKGQDAKGGDAEGEDDKSGDAEGKDGEDGDSAEGDKPAAKKPRVIDVDKLIAKYNEGRAEPVAFDAQARSWMELGALPEDIDRIRSGELNVPTDDPYMLVFWKDGEEQEPIFSNPDTKTPPAAKNVPAYATEIDAANRPNPWVPKAASETAKEVDAMFNFIMWVNYIFTGLIGFLMVFFCIKYRRRPGVRADQSITHNTPLEIFWSVVPTILVAIMFWGGYTTFLDMRTSPPDAMQIDVSARQWGWDFKYDNGVATVGEIHVPENTPVELVMSSVDVIHSFHLPAFRQKSDVLPNRFTKIWFNSGEPAIYRVYCSEYCGEKHSNMYSKLVVESREDYDAWLKKEGEWMLNELGELKPALEIGKLTYERMGCNTCHSLDGKHGTAPTFSGLWGRERRFDAAGTDSVIADENYVTESINNPHKRLVYPYGKNMPVYGSAIKPEMVKGIIALLKEHKDDERDPDAWE